MKKRSWQQDMYEIAGACVAQRLVLAGIAGVIRGAAWWLLLGDGLMTLGRWLGWNLQVGSVIRRLALTVGFSVYYIRILFTVFVFLRRGIGWLEVFSIAPFMLLAVLLMGVSGGTNHEAFGWVGSAGAIFFSQARGSIHTPNTSGTSGHCGPRIAAASTHGACFDFPGTRTISATSSCSSDWA
jgi:hypothetical protein